MENKEEAVVYGSDVDELERKESTDQIKKLAGDVLAESVSNSPYTLWQEYKVETTYVSIRASTEGRLATYKHEVTLPQIDGFSPVAIRAASAIPNTNYALYSPGYYYGTYMYGYKVNMWLGVLSTTPARFTIDLIVTYIRNNLNIPTITIPQ